MQFTSIIAYAHSPGGQVLQFFNINTITSVLKFNHHPHRTGWLKIPQFQMLKHCIAETIQAIYSRH
jgi:hypothetical protein